jgi:hypothetical protein
MVPSPSGGYWFGCFACADVVPADYVVLLYGEVLGLPIRLERGACALCSALLLTTPLPADLGDGQTLTRVELSIPLEL